MTDDDSIGARIAAERKLRGLTQTQLADRAHVSASLVRKVEQGNREVTHAFLSAVASALGVDRTYLTGQPYRDGGRRHDAVHDLVPELRRELVSYRLSPTEDRPVPTMASLRNSTAAVSAARHDVDLTKLGELLPLALADLRTGAWTMSGTDREQVMGMLAEVLYAARQFLHNLGYADLATLVADRYRWAAERSGDPLALALAGVFDAGELDAAADWRGARSVMADTIEGLDPIGTEQALQIEGFLHLMAGWMAAHGGDSDSTWSHWMEAKDRADRMGYDGDAYRLSFGPTNVAIWGCSLGVELSDGAAAVDRARAVRLTAETPPERAGHHFLDRARGQLLNGDRSGALQSLLTARQTAPQQTRYHPAARETVRALARAERRSSESLRSLAVWMGVPD